AEAEEEEEVNGRADADTAAAVVAGVEGEEPTVGSLSAGIAAAVDWFAVAALDSSTAAPTRGSSRATTTGDTGPRLGRPPPSASSLSLLLEEDEEESMAGACSAPLFCSAAAISPSDSDATLSPSIPAAARLAARRAPRLSLELLCLRRGDRARERL